MDVMCWSMVVPQGDATHDPFLIQINQSSNDKCNQVNKKKQGIRSMVKIESGKTHFPSSSSHERKNATRMFFHEFFKNAWIRASKYIIRI